MKNNIVAMVLGQGGEWEELEPVEESDDPEVCLALVKADYHICIHCFARGVILNYVVVAKRLAEIGMACLRCRHQWKLTVSN